MAKRGRKPTPLKVVEGRGTVKKTRPRKQAVPDINGEPIKPEWLMGRAIIIWDVKVATYKARGQNVVGCEGALAQYCQLEAKLEQLWGAHETPTTAMINAHRVYANEFFDTSASKHVSTGKTKENRFKRNGKQAPV